MEKQIFGSGLATDINGETVPRTMVLLCNALFTTSFSKAESLRRLRNLT